MRRSTGTTVALTGLLLTLTATFGLALVRTNTVSGPVDHAPRAPILLTVDDAAAPLAVEGTPQFGWVPVDVDRGSVQAAYDLVVSARPINGGAPHPIWRSGKVQSAQESYVTAPGLVVQRDRSYTWMVRTWDRAGRVGPFSKPVRFDAGILDKDWHADWIRRPVPRPRPPRTSRCCASDSQ